MILRPSVAMPGCLALTGVFLAMLGRLTLQAAGFRDAWWAIVPLWALAAWILFTVVKVLRNRYLLSIEVTTESLTVGKVAVTRKEVTAVRRYKELMFKGVRLDLLDGRWLGIAHQHHQAPRLLRVLREHGYPVVDHT